MKIFAVAIAIVFSISPLTLGQRRVPKSSGPAKKRIQREILNMEGQLKRALAKCNATALNLLLADYYADSFGDSESAVGKQRTIESCKTGSVTYYSIIEHLEFSIQNDLVVISGIAKDHSNTLQTDVASTQPAKEVRVKRTWTNKSGRWLLISQWIGPEEEESGRR